ncbi:MAG: rod shape-determining protein MreC [Thermoanaerobaculia bacterium]
MSPRRVRLLFVALLVGQLFLVAGQEPDRGSAGSLLEGLTLRTLGPLARLVNAGSEGFASAREGLRLRGDLASENRDLKREVLELRRRELRMAGLEEEIDGLSKTIDFSRRQATELRIAEVVHADFSSWLRSLILYVGTGAAHVNQPVLSDDGLVGRVIRVSGAYAKVQLLTDRAASSGVQLERSRRQGVVRGSSPGELLLDFIPRQAEVEVGESVLTAGIDGVYPRGIRVGTVVSVEPGNEVFHRIVVRPAVDFSRLSFVYLLEGEAVPRELATEEEHASP